MTGPEQPPLPGPEHARVPPPLLVAAGLVGVEALLLVGYGVVLLPAISSSRVAMGVTTPLFFLVYGAGLGAAAWLLVRLRSWVRAPVVLAQLIQLGVAWSFHGGGATGVGVGLGVLALLVLAGIFHPASIRALGEDDAAV